jgi:hypothetical protein
MTGEQAIDHRKLMRPDIRLSGPVDQDMLLSLVEQLGSVLDQAGPIVLEVTTNGGDADVGRRIAQHLRALQEDEKRQCLFLGVTTVFSAGITIMAAVPQGNRYLTKDTALLIHERQTNDDKPLSGPLSAAIVVAQAKVDEIKFGIAAEWKGFSELILGTDITEVELKERISHNWYMSADEALQRRLVAGLV